MPATQPTSHSATAKSPQSAATPRADIPAPATAATVKGKSATKAPAKPATKAPAKVAAKAATKAPAKAATKAPAKAATKAPAVSKPEAAKAGVKPATGGQAALEAAKSVKTVAAKVAPAGPKEAAEAKAEPQGHAQDEAHAKAHSKEPVQGAAADKPAPKGDKPEPKRDRAHEESAKKPLVRRSSLVDFPVPPAPVRPPFVPPKPVTAATEEAAPVGVNASHSPALIQKQRQRLLDLRDDLVDALSGMTRDTIRNAPEGSEASGSGMHQGDAGSDAYDRDFALSVLAKEQDALYEIDQALRRIQKGIYGVCEMSNRKIPQARLEAIPFARLTVECQSQWEKEYGNRRFRPSNEVGFSGGNLIEDEDSETVLLDEEED